jgi:hypothetical protein
MSTVNEEYLETLGETAARSLRGEEWDGLDAADRRKAAGDVEWQIRDLVSAGFAVVDLNPDRQHSPERTAHTADVLAECVRVLAYAAEKNGGLVYPGDVYRLMGEFRVAGDRVPELGERIGRFLEREHNAGRLRRDDGGDVTPDVREALDRLNDLRAAGIAFYNAATKAQNALSHVAGTEA